MNRYTVHSMRGTMVGYEYFVVDSQTEQPVEFFTSYGAKVMYTDAKEEADKACAKLNNSEPTDKESPFDKRLDDMLLQCSAVIYRHEYDLQRRLKNMQRSRETDNAVYTAIHAEYDALVKLRMRVDWYRKTGTVME